MSVSTCLSSSFTRLTLKLLSLPSSYLSPLHRADLYAYTTSRMTYAPSVQSHMGPKSTLESTNQMVRLADLVDQRVISSPDELQEPQITNVNGCDIVVTSNCENFGVEDTANSRIFIGPVEGRVLVRNCHNCHITVACNELVIENSDEIVLRIHCPPQRALLQDVKKVAFFPYSIDYQDHSIQLKNANIDLSSQTIRSIEDLQSLTSDTLLEGSSLFFSRTPKQETPELQSESESSTDAVRNPFIDDGLSNLFISTRVSSFTYDKDVAEAMQGLSHSPKPCEDIDEKSDGESTSCFAATLIENLSFAENSATRSDATEIATEIDVSTRDNDSTSRAVDTYSVSQSYANKDSPSCSRSESSQNLETFPLNWSERSQSTLQASPKSSEECSISAVNALYTSSAFNTFSGNSPYSHSTPHTIPLKVNNVQTRSRKESQEARILYSSTYGSLTNSYMIPVLCENSRKQYHEKYQNANSSQAVSLEDQNSLAISQEGNSITPYSSVVELPFMCIVDYFGTAIAKDSTNFRFSTGDDIISMSSYGDIAPSMAELNPKASIFRSSNKSNVGSSLVLHVNSTLDSHVQPQSPPNSPVSPPTLGDTPSDLTRTSKVVTPKRLFGSLTRKKETAASPEKSTSGGNNGSKNSTPVSSNSDLPLRRLRPSKYEIARESQSVGRKSTLGSRAALLGNESMVNKPNNPSRSRDGNQPSFDPPSSSISKSTKVKDDDQNADYEKNNGLPEVSTAEMSFADADEWDRFVSQPRRRVSGFDGSQDEIQRNGLPRSVIVPGKREEVYFQLTFDDALLNMQTVDLTEAQKALNLKSSVTSFKNCSKFQILVYKCVGKPKFDPVDEPIVTFYLCLVNTVYLHSEEVHLASLQSIYSTLEGVRSGVAAEGSHWKQLGFSTEDPSADLSNVGMFGVLNMLYLTDKFKNFAITLYQQSYQARKEYKFAALCIIASEIMIMFIKHPVAVRAVKEFNSAHHMIGELYATTLYSLCEMVKSGRHSADASAALRNDGFKNLTSNPRKALLLFRSVTTLCVDATGTSHVTFGGPVDEEIERSSFAIESSQKG